MWRPSRRKRSVLDKTYYETGATPAEPTTASAVYDPAAKPTLGDGEQIRYFSVDGAGNAEAAHPRWRRASTRRRRRRPTTSRRRIRCSR